MKKLLSLTGVLIALGASTSVFAAPMIVGNITIGALGSTVTVNQGPDTVVFSPAAPNNNAIVTFVNGSYTALTVGASVVYQNFDYTPGQIPSQLIWSTSSGPAANFTLTTVTLVDESGPGVVLTGTGMATLAGFDPTPGFWSFSASQASAVSVFTFSSTNISPIPSVPDGGTTAVLLGMGLVAVGFIARRKNA